MDAPKYMTLENLENYYSMLDNYFFNENICSKDFEKNKKYIDKCIKEYYIYN